jgi:hypothetical protein
VRKLVAIAASITALITACRTDAPIVPGPQLTAAPTPTAYSGPFDPLGQDRDCSEFRSQREAQAFYDAAGGPQADRHGLDRDRNGKACEELPR